MFTQTDDDKVWQEIQDTRKDLLKLFETLSEDQLSQASLCAGWRVRDVIAHLVIEYTYTPQNAWRQFLEARLNINRFIQHTAIAAANKPTCALLDDFRLLIEQQARPTVVPLLNVLVDLLVHEQDIRLPLGIPKQMDRAALELIFDNWHPERYNLGERITGLHKTLNGLQFVVSDLNLTRGAGAVVKGDAQAILLAVLGRTVTYDRLTGAGAVILRNRSK